MYLLMMPVIFTVLLVLAYSAYIDVVRERFIQATISAIETSSCGGGVQLTATYIKRTVTPAATATATPTGFYCP